MIHYMSSGSALIIRLMAGYIKKISLYKISDYPKPNNYGRKKRKIELEFSNYATKYEVKQINRCGYIIIS